MNTWWTDEGIHMIEVFPDIWRPTPCVYQTQIIWNGGIDMIKGKKFLSYMILY